MLTENEKEEARREARAILEKFGRELDNVDVKSVKNKAKDKGFREEDGSKTEDKLFKKLILANAPYKDENFIIAEKAGWK